MLSCSLGQALSGGRAGQGRGQAPRAAAATSRACRAASGPTPPRPAPAAAPPAGSWQPASTPRSAYRGGGGEGRAGVRLFFRRPPREEEIKPRLPEIVPREEEIKPRLPEIVPREEEIKPRLPEIVPREEGLRGRCCLSAASLLASLLPRCCLAASLAASLAAASLLASLLHLASRRGGSPPRQTTSLRLRGRQPPELRPATDARADCTTPRTSAQPTAH